MKSTNSDSFNDINVALLSTPILKSSVKFITERIKRDQYELAITLEELAKRGNA